MCSPTHYISITSFLSFLNLVNADFEQIKSDLQKLVPKTILNNSFVEDIKFQILEEGLETFKHDHIHVIGSLDDVMDRGISADNFGDLKFIFEDLQQYGCWCNFVEGRAHGGHPVNDIDQMCKTLFDGYSCSGIDSEDSCKPYQVDYVSGFNSQSFFNTAEMLKLACEQNNDNDCATTACITEGNFVRDIILEVIVNGYFDVSKKHANGFDVNVECNHKTGTHAQRVCCGEYPNRFPYNSKDGVKGCCGQNVYDTAMFECCQDGSVQFNCAV